MPIPDHLHSLIHTEKQKAFPNDFLATWQSHETWDLADIGGDLVEAPKKFKILSEDVVDYNLSCGEKDPLMVDPEYAAKHSPTGGLVVHPVFVTAIVFYCLGDAGKGTWIRTPGARNPYQDIDLKEPLKVGEEITLKFRNSDKYLQRGKNYANLDCYFYNSEGVLKGTWLCALILPENKEAARKYAEA